jgi:hypothetical protein
MATEKYSLKGWNLIDFLKGRKKLLVTGVGAIAAYLITQSPLLSGIIGAGAELIYAVFDYYLKE